MTKTTGRIIKCPFCRKPTVYAQSNPFRPFCSERCKNEDVIAWADERYRIASDQDDEDQDEMDDTSSEETP